MTLSLLVNFGNATLTKEWVTKESYNIIMELTLHEW